VLAELQQQHIQWYIAAAAAAGTSLLRVLLLRLRLRLLLLLAHVLKALTTHLLARCTQVMKPGLLLLLLLRLCSSPNNPTYRHTAHGLSRSGLLLLLLLLLLL
jgi:hypothetical protein